MCHLVYDRNINFHHICRVVESSYKVLSKYSLGGATEIRFSNDCQSGTIEEVFWVLLHRYWYNSKTKCSP